MKTALLLLITAIYFAVVTQVAGRVGDAGTLIYGAQRVSEGALPGRDFMEVMGPGSFYWLALFFVLFGKAWLVTRVQLVATSVVTVALYYALARKVSSGRASMLLWLFVVLAGLQFWPDTSHHWDSNLFAAAALWCFVKRFSLAAGSLAAITSCFMQQKGAYLLAAFLLCAAFRSHWRDGAKLAAGFAFVGFVVLAIFWRAGGLSDLVYANLVFPLAGYGATNQVPYAFGLPPLGPASLTSLLIVSLPVVLMGATAACFVGPDSRQKWLAGPLPEITVSAMAVLLAEMHRRDFFHLVFAAPLLMIALFGSDAVLDRSKDRLLSKGLGWALTLCLFVTGTLHLVTFLRGTQMAETPRGPVRFAGDGAALRFLGSNVKAREWVFVYPYNPIYYYLADVSNPSRYSILVYGYNTPEQFQETIDCLERKQVPWILWSVDVYGDKLRTWFPKYRHPAQDQLLLERYLENHYKQVTVEDGFRILHRSTNGA